MNLLPGPCHGRRLVLLAPDDANLEGFSRPTVDRLLHDEALAAVQRFRGAVYLGEHNLAPSDLEPDGRHLQPVDAQSWHLLTVGAAGTVEACARITLHNRTARFSDTMVAHSALAHSPVWGGLLHLAVEEEIRSAQRAEMHFAEFGGWAVARASRCTTEAVRMVLAGYALGGLLGGVRGVSTVNRCHHSSSILRRIGGWPLVVGGTELPCYYEPRYRADLEILRFDSSLPNPHYRFHIAACGAALRDITVVSAGRRTGVWPVLRCRPKNPTSDLQVKTVIPDANPGESASQLYYTI